MDFPKIPRKLQEEAVIEGNIYFFEKNASFGIPGHMHVCIKRADRLLFFSPFLSILPGKYLLKTI